MNIDDIDMIWKIVTTLSTICMACRFWKFFVNLEKKVKDSQL